MKSKKVRIKDGIKRLSKLKDATILKYTEEIDYDEELSLYNVMIEHFSNGDLDEDFITDVTKGMNEEEVKSLFGLVREYQGLCFCDNNPEYWLDSLENSPVVDYDLIAYSILDSYNFLLELAKLGGRAVLEQLKRLQDTGEYPNMAIVQHLRESFVDDKVLSMILLDMSSEDSFYNIFTDAQRVPLFTFPEGTLYAYGDNSIKITSPIILATEIYNRVSDKPVVMEDAEDLESVALGLEEFFHEETIDFAGNVLVLASEYRDYFRKKNINLNNEVVDIMYDVNSKEIQEAWKEGNSFLGGMMDSPYSSSSK